MTRTLAALALVATIAACGSGSDGATKDAAGTQVQPISQVDLHAVVTVICAESLPDMDRQLNAIDAISNSRYVRVLNEMHRTCPGELNALVAYIGG